MYELPKLIIWPKAIERPKTLYLKRGFEELGIPIQESKKWLKRLRPRTNPRGPYVYPIEFIFEKKRGIAAFDINTIPRMIFTKFLRKDMLYFKIHLHKKDKKRYKIFPAPNSVSRLSLIDNLDYYRELKDKKEYKYDFFFNGWHDDDGTRMKCVRKAKTQKEWKARVGLQPFKHHTTVPKYLEDRRMDYEEHLKTQCRSRINLALPGGRALPYCSFRHVELWAMGCFILSTAPNLILPGEADKCMGIFKRDMSDFVEQVNYYLEHDEEREQIAQAGRDYFDKYLTPKAHAEYFIKVFNKHLLGRNV
jgi:glycosyltransferase involved in cell wall biosynthesis